MPHVKVEGQIDLQALAETLAFVVESHPPTVLKIAEAYLGQSGDRLLIEAVVVEGHLRQNFFVLIRQEDDAVVIRCHPAHHVQKTDGVKQLIAVIARKCIASNPGTVIGNTNLTPFLDN